MNKNKQKGNFDKRGSVPSFMDFKFREKILKDSEKKKDKDLKGNYKEFNSQKEKIEYLNNTIDELEKQIESIEEEKNTILKEKSKIKEDFDKYKLDTKNKIDKSEIDNIINSKDEQIKKLEEQNLKLSSEM